MVSRSPDDPFPFSEDRFKRTLSRLVPREEVESFEDCFEKTTFRFSPPNRIVVDAPTLTHKALIELRYLPHIQGSARTLLKRDAVVEVLHHARVPVDSPVDSLVTRFEAVAGNAGILRDRHLGPGNRLSTAMGEDPGRSRGDLGSTLNPTYELDALSLGPGNRFAVLACLEAFKATRWHYNPLVLYGESGSGKSHLLQGFHSELTRRCRRSSVYFSCADFRRFSANHLGALPIPGSFENGMQHLIRAMEGVDFLFLDDVQQLHSDSTLCDALAGVLDHFAAEGRQVVIALDRDPGSCRFGAVPRADDIRPGDASDRTGSDRAEAGENDKPAGADPILRRLRSGLVLEILRPGLPVLVEILQRKLSAVGVKVSSEIAERLARGTEGYPRELDGLVNRLRLDIETNREYSGPADTSGSRQRQRTVRRLRAPTNLDIPEILEHVAAYFSKTPSDLRSPSRKKTTSLARQVAMYLARELTEMSYQRIGRYFGGKHHATVLYSVGRIRTRIQKDPVLARDLDTLVGVIHRSHKD